MCEDVPRTAYENMVFIGYGAYGRIYKAVKNKKHAVAVKTISAHKQRLQSSQFVENELRVWSMLDHLNCIKYNGHWIDHKKRICIEMELCKHDCLTMIEHFGKPTELQAARIMHQALSGLAYIHSNGIIHRDLKLENLLIDYNDDVKICDFGMSIIAKEAHDVCGSVNYMPPEQHENAKYTLKCDLWSMGVIAAALLTNKYPYDPSAIKAAEYKVNYSNRWWDGVSDSAKKFVARLLNVKEEDRPHASDALLDPWFDILKDPNKAK